MCAVPAYEAGEIDVYSLLTLENAELYVRALRVNDYIRRAAYD